MDDVGYDVLYFSRYKEMNKLILILLSIAVALSVGGCNNDQSNTTWSRPVHPLVDEGMTLMKKKAILDGIFKYNDAIKKGDNLLDICIAAKNLRSAYEVAKEYDEALIWKKLEQKYCENKSTAL